MLISAGQLNSTILHVFSFLFQMTRSGLLWGTFCAVFMDRFHQYSLSPIFCMYSYLLISFGTSISGWAFLMISSLYMVFATISYDKPYHIKGQQLIICITSSTFVLHRRHLLSHGGSFPASLDLLFIKYLVWISCSCIAAT